MKKNVSNKNENKRSSITGKNALGIFAVTFSFEMCVKIWQKTL